MQDLMESATYREAVEMGEKSGEKKGRQQAIRESILDFLQERFGGIYLVCRKSWKLSHPKMF